MITTPSTSAPAIPDRPRLGRLLALTTAAWVVLAATLFAWSGRFSLAAVEQACGAPAPDVRTAPSGSDVRAFLAACGPDGLAAYRDLQVVDLVYPAVNAALLALVLAVLIRRLPFSLRWLLAIPVVAALGDYVENVGAWTLLGQAGTATSWADVLFPVGSAVKVAATWSSWLAVVVLLAVVGASRTRSRIGRHSATVSTREHGRVAAD